MRKSFYLIVIFISITITTFAQNTYEIETDEFKPYSNWGIRQGINYTSVMFTPNISNDITLGYTGGLVFKYQNMRRVALQMELNYVQKGWTETLDTVDNSYNRKMEYIDFPLMTHIVFGKKKIKFHINIGTAFGYMISEKEELTINDETYRMEYYEKEIEKKFDYSVLGDVGFIFNTGLGEIQTSFRYQWTLTDLFEVTNETQFSQSQNLIIGFSVNYFFYSSK